MAISSHRLFKGQPVSGNCQASPSNRERIESQPERLPERPTSLSDLRKSTQKVEIRVAARGGQGHIWSNPETRGMAISSHRPFKAKPVSGNCQASPSNRERMESQPDWRPERPKSLSDLRKSTQKVEIRVGPRGGRGHIWQKSGKSCDGNREP